MMDTTYVTVMTRGIMKETSKAMMFSMPGLSGTTITDRSGKSSKTRDDVRWVPRAVIGSLLKMPDGALYCTVHRRWYNRRAQTNLREYVEQLTRV
jgi:hypothetical protein